MSDFTSVTRLHCLVIPHRKDGILSLMKNECSKRIQVSLTGLLNLYIRCESKGSFL